MTALADATTLPAAAPTSLPAGHTAMGRALRRQAEAPVRSPLARALASTTGADPLTPAAHGPFSAALGARAVGQRLTRLTRLGTGRSVPGSGPQRWHVLHALPLGPGRSPSAQAPADDPRDAADHLVVDHLVIGPCGVVVVTSAHEPGSRVAATGSSYVVDGRRLPLLRTARHEAQRVQELLGAAAGRAVPVRAVVAVVGADRLTLSRRGRQTGPGSVTVRAAPRLVRWLRRSPALLDGAAVAALAAAAADPRTWRGPDPATGRAGTAPGPADHTPDDHTPDDHTPAFELLLRRVRRADRVRQGWVTAAAVAGSTSVVVALLDLVG